MGNTIRFTKLLGECRRQMNGAVAGSMRYYGAEYGLNYGVSLPTVRSLALAEGKDHTYAKYLYLQQVREIRLASLHIAEPNKIVASELEFWGAGIINSEVAEEAAFALFQHVDSVAQWLDSENELLVYTALLSLAKSRNLPLSGISSQLLGLSVNVSVLISSALITLLESYYRELQYQGAVIEFIGSLPESKATEHIRTEMEWRCELL